MHATLTARLSAPEAATIPRLPDEVRERRIAEALEQQRGEKRTIDARCREMRAEQEEARYGASVQGRWPPARDGEQDFAEAFQILPRLPAQTAQGC